MEQLKNLDLLQIQISKDKMEAYIDIPSETPTGELTDEYIRALLKKNKVSFGINDEVIHRLVNDMPSCHFPEVIAIGRDPVDGVDGEVKFVVDFQHAVDNKEKTNFRDILRIPSVEEDERLAYIIEPTEGTHGKNVFGENIPASNGKPSRVKAGENVTFKRKNSSFYAKISGQLNFNKPTIQIQPLYEVQGDLDLHTGNLNFVGSIVIRGNVPSGYKIDAKGDVTIHGLVEGAEISAGGSIHISEGIVGLNKGFISAGGDIRVGYLNQAQVEAGQDIIVQNSILHSQCVVKNSVFCQSGNIIGGSISAGFSIISKDVGNRMSTLTTLSLGMNEKVEKKRRSLIAQHKKKEDEVQKLERIGTLLDAKRDNASGLSSKERITALRQRNSLQHVNEEIDMITEELEELESLLGNLDDASVEVNGTLYSNVYLSFGKYQRTSLQEYHQVTIVLDDNEVVISGQ
ncbi:DUF342 domain-containing protein [Halobacillus seohaensis]|uniref:DUF342 domain-containing protein n=1 Tax=Halobacillus seohaensis TaxID=447421 RepID=A0ABW2EFT5_9BACI